MQEMCVNYGEWKPVPGIDPMMVLVSSEGWARVRTKSKGGIQALGPPRKGSYSFETGTRRIGVNGTTYLVHRLVAIAFLEPQPSRSHTVDHANRNPDDNRVCNLRWATRSEQNKNQNKRKVQRSAKPVVLTAPDGVVHEYLSTIEAGKAIGSSPGNISNAAHHGWTVNGYKAMFKATEDQNDLVVDGEVERWAPVADGPDLYLSTMGRVQWNRWSVMGLRTTPVPNRRMGGYCMVKVGDGQKLIHQLVLRTFGQPPPVDDGTYTVDHLNHVRHDNRLSNLKWSTKKEQRSNRSQSVVAPQDLPFAPANIDIAARKQHYQRVGMAGAWLIGMRRKKRAWIVAKGIMKGSNGARTAGRTAASCETRRVGVRSSTGTAWCS